MMRCEDDYNLLTPPAFIVGDCSNVDINTPAVSGEDYIKKVHLESKRCPAVMVANLDLGKFNDKQTVRYDHSNGFIPAPPGLAPPEHIRDEQIYKFSLLRAELFSKMDEIKEHLVPVELPNFNNRLQWCEYCLGSVLCSKIYGDLTPTMEEAVAKWKLRKMVDGHEPLLSIVLSVPYKHIEKLLYFHLLWMERIGFSRVQGHWIFALFSVLQKPLDPGLCDILRKLSRICAKLRSELVNETNEQLFGLNYIICLISDYFGQKDMSDHCVSERTPTVEIIMEDAYLLSSSDSDEEESYEM